MKKIVWVIYSCMLLLTGFYSDGFSQSKSHVIYHQRFKNFINPKAISSAELISQFNARLAELGKLDPSLINIQISRYNSSNQENSKLLTSNLNQQVFIAAAEQNMWIDKQINELESDTVYSSFYLKRKIRNFLESMSIPLNDKPPGPIDVPADLGFSKEKATLISALFLAETKSDSSKAEQNPQFFITSYYDSVTAICLSIKKGDTSANSFDELKTVIRKNLFIIRKSVMIESISAKTWFQLLAESLTADEKLFWNNPIHSAAMYIIPPFQRDIIPSISIQAGAGYLYLFSEISVSADLNYGGITQKIDLTPEKPNFILHTLMSYSWNKTGMLFSTVNAGLWYSGFSGKLKKLPATVNQTIIYQRDQVRSEYSRTNSSQTSDADVKLWGVLFTTTLFKFEDLVLSGGISLENETYSVSRDLTYSYIQKSYDIPTGQQIALVNKNNQHAKFNKTNSGLSVLPLLNLDYSFYRYASVSAYVSSGFTGFSISGRW